MAGLLWAAPALAFANVPIGAVVDNDVLPVFTGGEQSLLGEAGVSVFIFFKPGLEHSNQAMSQIAALENELAGRQVHWCAIVSDRVPRAEVEAAVKAAGLRMPVLIDRGDKLYGKLGAVLHPVAGITDANHRLVAYQPFAKVNYPAIIRAHIRHALGEISDAELAAVLNPVAAPLGGDVSVAHRYLRLAEKQFQTTNSDQALANVRKSLDKNPTAEAYSLQGRILQAQGKPDEAAAAFASAHKLDSNDTNVQKTVK
jgi:tetratricopeptide (TPR) repeat protein